MLNPSSHVAVVAGLLAAMTGSVASQVSSADSPAARRVRELVRVINTGNRDSVRAYVVANFAPSFLQQITADDHANILSGMYLNGGEMTVHNVETPEANRASALVEARRTEVWRRVGVRVEPNPPHLIAGAQVGQAAPPSAAKALSDAAIVADLKAYVERIAKSDDFSGTVLLARNGRELFKGAYGVADKNFGAPNRVDTKFNLGSMNKMFTAVAIAQLVERGKLSFEDPVSKHLPNALKDGAGDKVRVKHLLTHSSGLGSYFNDEWDGMSRARLRTVDDFMTLVGKESLQFEPGTRTSYSNSGFIVLGKLVEVASGKSYFDYIRENIYRPAGMVNSDAYDLDQVTPNLAVGYDRQMTPNGVRWRNNIFMHVIRGGPAGGGYSTVEDLHRFATALRSGKLVGKQLVDQLMSPKPELNSPTYGFGFGLFDGGKIAGHGGGFPGINSNLDMFLDSGYTAVVMSNYSNGAQPVVQRIRRLVAGQKERTASND